jgi:hypothetical protein
VKEEEVFDPKLLLELEYLLLFATGILLFFVLLLYFKLLGVNPFGLYVVILLDLDDLRFNDEGVTWLGDDLRS